MSAAALVGDPEDRGDQASTARSPVRYHSFLGKEYGLGELLRPRQVTDRTIVAPDRRTDLPVDLLDEMFSGAGAQHQASSSINQVFVSTAGGVWAQRLRRLVAGVVATHGSSTAGAIDEVPWLADTFEDLQTADTVTAVVVALRRRYLTRTADRIEELVEVNRAEPGQPEIDLDTLKRAVTVMLEHPDWGEPEITLRGDQYPHLAWTLKEDGQVAISFMPDGLVALSALSAPTTVPKYLNIGGRHEQEAGIKSLSWFTDRIVPR